MKSLITKTLLGIIILMAVPRLSAQAFNTDPALAFAVKTAGDKEKDALDGIKSEQSKIRNLQVLANAQLKKIEDIQKKSYDYLSNISAAVQNAYDIKKSVELTKAIASMCDEVRRAAIENPQGLITTAIATKYISEITKEVATTYSYIASIALNKKTLLNAAERLEITWRVRNHLSNIYYKLYNLIYQIRALKFVNLPELIAPTAYYNIVAQKEIAESIIRDYYRN